MNHSNICPKCGKENMKEFQFCGECGTPLYAQENQSPVSLVESNTDSVQNSISKDDD